jgi:hypothetical protein
MILREPLPLIINPAVLCHILACIIQNVITQPLATFSEADVTPSGNLQMTAKNLGTSLLGSVSQRS